MELDQTLSGLDATVRLDSTPGAPVIKRRRLEPPLEEIYPLDIQFYTRAPFPISIEKMKILVKERILVLKEIHSIMKSSSHGEINENRKIVTSKLENKRLHRYAKFVNSPGHRTHSIEELEDRVIDHVSFVALRLALVFANEDRILHQRLEEVLFQLRVSALDDEGIRELLAFNKIEYEKISDQERIELKDELGAMLSESADYDNTEFFKIPALKLLGFIKLNEIHMKAGIAYVPHDCMGAALRLHYHHYLNSESAAVDRKNLEMACKIEDGSKKFNEFFQFCCQEFKTIQHRIIKESNISVHMIDKLATTAFPPCMRTIHECLRDHHHLKHESRLQYTLFLKAIGLNVEDTVMLFREEFIRTVSAERFEKEYAYYIYHAYGMRGRKFDTPPKDCASIIDTATSIGDCSGCVFAHNGIADMEDLRRKLSRWKISENYRADIIEYARHGQCGNACAKYFHAINRHPSEGPITHPNTFFVESRRLSELAEDCISDTSEESDNEEKVIEVVPAPVEGDKDARPPNFSVLSNDLLDMIITWEGQTCPGALRAGTMVEL